MIDQKVATSLFTVFLVLGADTALLFLSEFDNFSIKIAALSIILIISIIAVKLLYLLKFARSGVSSNSAKRAFGILSFIYVCFLLTWYFFIAKLFDCIVDRWDMKPKNSDRLAVFLLFLMYIVAIIIDAVSFIWAGKVTEEAENDEE